MEHDNRRRLRPAVIASCAVLIAFIVNSSVFAKGEPPAPSGTKPDESAELVKKLQNPVTACSVPVGVRRVDPYPIAEVRRILLLRLAAG